MRTAMLLVIAIAVVAVIALHVVTVATGEFAVVVVMAADGERPRWKG